jgi:uncharacterized protein YgfB (UPF0149 family)
MSKAPSLPSYTVLTKAIQQFQPNGHAAQIHGLLCGYVCATPDKFDSQWEGMLPGLKDNKKAYTSLQQVIAVSYQQLREFSFEFGLVLPGEKTDINVRAEALGLWCQGFLTGLELGQVPIQNREPGQVTEALEDLIEISGIGFGDIAENDEDETAYFELVEYVRLSVLMIFHELKTDKTPEVTNQNPLLH